MAAATSSPTKTDHRYERSARQSQRQHGVELAPGARRGPRPGRGSRPRPRGRGPARRPTSAPPRRRWRAARPGRARARTISSRCDMPDVAGVAVADRLAERGRLGAEPLAGVDVAVEQGERGLPGAQQVVVARLAQPLGQVLVLGQVGPERRPIRSPAGRSPTAAGAWAWRSGSPARFAEVGDLGGDRGPLASRCRASTACRAGRAGSWPASPGRRGRGRSPRPARPAAGPAAGRPARSAATGGPAPRSPAPRRPSRGRRSAVAGRVQHGDQVGAGHGEPGAEPVQAQRDRAEQVGVAGGRRPGPGGVEQGRAPPAASPARSRRSASSVSRSTRSASGSRLARRRPPPPAARARWPAASANANRAVSASAAARAQRTAGAGPATGYGGGEVTGQFGRRTPGRRARARRTSAAATRWCRSSRRAGGSAGVDRLAVQVVGEPGRPASRRRREHAGRGAPRRPGPRPWPGRSPVTSASTSGSSVGTGDRGRVQQRGARRRQPGQPAADHLPDRGRHAVGRRRRRRAGGTARGRRTGARRCAGAPSRPSAPRRRHRRSPAPGRPPPAAAARAARPARRRWRDRRARRRRGPQLIRPVRADQQQRAGLGCGRRGNAAGPRSTDRPTAGRRGSPPPGAGGRPGASSRADRVEDPQPARVVAPGAAGAGSPRSAPARSPPGRVGRGARGRRGSSSSARSAWVHGHQAGAWSPSQQVPHTTARRPARLGREPGQQRRLADARLTGDQHQPGPARRRPARRRDGDRCRRQPAGPAVRPGRRSVTHRHCRLGHAGRPGSASRILADRQHGFWRVPGDTHPTDNRRTP